MRLGDEHLTIAKIKTSIHDAGGDSIANQPAAGHPKKLSLGSKLRIIIGLALLIWILIAAVAFWILT